MSNPKQNRPDWLTNDFIKKLLKDNQFVHEAEIHVKHQEVETITNNGDNYCSTILRITVLYQVASRGLETEQKTSFIVKVPLQEGPLATLIQKCLMETEMEAYKELLPKLNDIMKNENVEDDFVPKVFKTDVENILILEDLNASEYMMADRRQQLDYDHAVLTIKSIAKFHAASVKLQKNKPELFEKFKADIMFTNMNEDVKNVINSMIGEDQLQVIINEFVIWPETRNYVSFLKDLRRKFWDVYLGAIIPSDGEFRVLNHGDLWINNILYKYDHVSNVDTLKFLDFQLLRSTSPTVDLLNFLYSSVEFGVLNQCFNDFTKIYFESLNFNLEIYGCTERLDEAQFKRSLEQREIFSLLLCIVLLPYIFAGIEVDRTARTESPQTFPIVKFVRNKIYRTICAKYLHEFSKRDSFKTFK